MPFNGLTSFLQMMTMEKAMEMMMYQCPLTGLLHFYQKSKIGKKP